MAGPDLREQMLRFSQYPDFKGTSAFSRRALDDRAFFKDLIDQARIKAE